MEAGWRHRPSAWVNPLLMNGVEQVELAEWRAALTSFRAWQGTLAASCFLSISGAVLP